MNRSARREQRFRAAYDIAYDDVLRFVQRRTVSHAEDIVAEAMVVAWRRIDDLPRRPDDARAWLFGIARNCLLNSARSQGRQQALAVRLAQVGEAVGAASSPDGVDLAVTRLDLAAAWATLTPDDQDVLALTIFEGLTSPQAGAVLGITSQAYRLRLSRARRVLRRHLEGAASHASALPQQELNR